MRNDVRLDVLKTIYEMELARQAGDGDVDGGNFGTLVEQPE